MVEGQGFRGGKAVNRKRRARKGCGTQRTFIHARAGIFDTAAVTPEHFHIGHQVMAKGHGLRRLQMGETGHDRGSMFLGFFRQHQL